MDSSVLCHLYIRDARNFFKPRGMVISNEREEEEKEREKVKEKGRGEDKSIKSYRGLANDPQDITHALRFKINSNERFKNLEGGG